MKILAVKMRQLGDTALWTAALEALLQLRPAQLSIAYPESYHALFEEDPRFQRKFPIKMPLSENAKVLELIQLEKFDAACVFHANPSLVRWINKTGIPKRIVHFHDRIPYPNASTKGIPDVGKPMSAIERDLNVVRSLGWSGESPKTKLLLNPQAWEMGNSALKQAGINPSLPFITISVGASRLAKRWPLENYLKLIKALSPKTQCVILSEDPGPFGSLANEFATHSKFIHTSKLSALMGCLSRAKCFVGSDSGVKHIAAGLGIPTVTLFGPESVGEWHGYAAESHLYVQAPVACRFKDPSPPEFSWCGENICPLSSHACMTLISAEKVQEKVELLLLR